MTFGEWLRTRINDLGLSNAEVARRAGVSATYIGNLIRDYSPNTKTGRVQPSAEVVRNIGAAVGAAPADALIAAGYLPPAASMEILDGVRISFDEKKFTKAQRDKLTDTIKILAAGMLAEAQDEPDPQDR